VDTETEFVVRLVVYPVLAKRNITHGKVIEIAAVGGFKSGNFNAGFRVELLCNAACDAVQFYTVQAAVLHGVRQHSKEVAHAHARLQNIAAAESHTLHCIINRVNHHWRSIVCVQGAGTGGNIFFLGEQPFQFGILLCPAIFFIIKSVWQTAPADILRKNLLFLGGGTPMLLFQLEQGADGFDVPGILLLCSALAQMIVRNAEISGSFRHRFNVQGFVCGGCIRECLPFAVDLHRDRQLVQFFIRRRLILPQTVLELLLVQHLVAPRIALRTGVDAHIGFANIADCTFDGFGGEVYNNGIANLVINCLFGSSIKGFILLLVQFPDKRQRFFSENRHPYIGQSHILQGNFALVKIHPVNPKFPAIHIDNGADGKIILFAQVLGLMVSAILA